MERSVYVFNIMVIKCTVNIACYMLHFVLLNEAVCIKPLQYHMYGLFLLSPNRARPLRRTALLYPPGNCVTTAVFGMITIRNYVYFV
jgi:hypothetical protein